MSPHVQSAVSMHEEGYNCAQAVLACCGADYGLPREFALKVAQAFGGGIGRTGGLCGAVSGALMVIGLTRCVKHGKDLATSEEAYRLARDLQEQFARRNGSLLCRELLGCDISTDEGVRRAMKAGLNVTICNKAVADAVEIVEGLLGPGGSRDKAVPE